MYINSKTREYKFHYISSKILITFAISHNIQYIFSFLDDRSDSSFVPPLTHIPRETESRHLHLSSSDMTLQDRWHDLFILSQELFLEKNHKDLKTVENT